jgi:hypothetical protein
VLSELRRRWLAATLLQLAPRRDIPPLKSAKSNGNFRQLQVHPPMTGMLCTVGAQSMITT